MKWQELEVQVFPKRSYQSYHGHIFSALTSLTSTAKENLFLSPCHGSVDTQRSHSRCHCGRHPAANLVQWQRTVVSVTCKEPGLGSAWFALCATVHCRSFMSLCILCEFYIVVDSTFSILFPSFPILFPKSIGWCVSLEIRWERLVAPLVTSRGQNWSSVRRTQWLSGLRPPSSSHWVDWVDVFFFKFTLWLWLT